ncbi:MAG: HNH endonuclease [Hyphomonadaceae bacterium]|nr:MAG: HNH endonuclease [Hyphomonadaceae bacterium]
MTQLAIASFQPEFVDIAKPTRHKPALVLNADYRPLSYLPLSLWSWQDVVKAVYQDKVEVVAHYDDVVHSPNFEMQLPSVVSLKQFVHHERNLAFTRFNVFLRDGFSCVYCGSKHDLTFDHVIPRSFGGRTTWENIVTACSPCNMKSECLSIACQKGQIFINCKKLAAASRPGICIQPGLIGFIGMSNYCLKSFVPLHIDLRIITYPETNKNKGK